MCNVTSRDLIQHDRHLEGQRHKNNVDIALGNKPAADTKKRKQGASGSESRKVLLRLLAVSCIEP